MSLAPHDALYAVVKLATSRAVNVATNGSNSSVVLGAQPKLADKSSHRRFVSPSLCDQLKSASHNAVAEVFREYNARVLPRLPIELWIEVWKNLDICHRVLVSHTCARWRSIALASTELWRDVDIHLPLSVECCLDHAGQSCMPGSLSTILKRSGVSTIFVTIREDNYVDGDLNEEAVELLSLLKPHIARIASLKLLFRRTKLFGQVMSANSVWPSLRTLSTICVGGIEGHADCGHAVLSVSFPKTVLPRLENLYLASDHRLMRDTAQCIPSTLLRLKTDVGSIPKLLEMLNPRTNLQQLDLMVQPTDKVRMYRIQTESEEDRKDARQQLMNIPSILIRILDDEAVAPMLQVFDNEHRKELSVCCTQASSVALCAPMFRSLQGQVRVVLLADANHHAIGTKVVDARGVIRSCSYTAKRRISSGQAKSILIGVGVIWEVIRNRAVHLHIPAGAWTTTVAELSSISTITVRSVILTCSKASDLSLVSMGNIQIGALTSLESLEIWIQDAAPPERIPFLRAINSIARAADIRLGEVIKTSFPRRYDGYMRWTIQLVPRTQVLPEDSKP